MHVNYKCQDALHWHFSTEMLPFSAEILSHLRFCPQKWTNWANSLIFQYHIAFICSGQWLSDRLRTSVPCPRILRRWKIDERCMTLKSGSWNLSRSVPGPPRSHRKAVKARDTTGISTLLSLACSCMQQLRPWTRHQAQVLVLPTTCLKYADANAWRKRANTDWSFLAILPHCHSCW